MGISDVGVLSSRLIIWIVKDWSRHACCRCSYYDLPKDIGMLVSTQHTDIAAIFVILAVVMPIADTRNSGSRMTRLPLGKGHGGTSKKFGAFLEVLFFFPLVYCV